VRGPGNISGLSNTLLTFVKPEKKLNIFAPIQVCKIPKDTEVKATNYV
jgi:hypothetical protein